MSNLVFLGGSLVPKGGQNPLEPIRYGCRIIQGKHTFNFVEIYKMLIKKGLSFEAKNISQLKKLINKLILEKKSNKKEIKSFKKIGNSILKRNFTKIRDLI